MFLFCGFRQVGKLVLFIYILFGFITCLSDQTESASNSLIKDTFMCSYAHAHFLVISMKKYIWVTIPYPPPYLYTLAKILNFRIL